eukprot:ANDGO_00474.mRNA.1 Cullin-4
MIRSSGPRKITIQPLKEKPRVDAEYFSQVWAKLKDAMTGIRTHAASFISMEELYQGVKDMCVEHRASALFGLFDAEFKQMVDVHARKVASALAGNTQFAAIVVSSQGASSGASSGAEASAARETLGVSSSYLDLLTRTWSDYVSQLSTLRNIFMEMEIDHVKHQTQFKSIWHYGLVQFRDAVLLADNRVAEYTVSAALDMLNGERAGESLSHPQALEMLVRMFLDLGIYSAQFAPFFLKSSKAFYLAESTQWMGRHGGSEIPAYLVHVEKRVSQESLRGHKYADHATGRELVRIVEFELVGAHIQVLLDKGFELMMTESRFDDLARLYLLFKKQSSGLDALKKEFLSYIKKCGVAVVQNLEGDATMIQQLLDLTVHCESVIQKSFQADSQFTYAQQEALDSVVNLRRNKPAELMAKFLDSKLKSANKEQTEAELEQLCDRVLVLFRCLHSKDVFEAFYKNDLAKRLLLGKSASIDAEKMMISKLKAECGAPYTTRIEGMFKDMEVSKDIMKSFKEHKVYGELRGFDLNVSVLTAGYWPSSAGGRDSGDGKAEKAGGSGSSGSGSSSIILPPDLTRYMEVFAKFYGDKYRDNRRLKWQYTYSTCNVKAFFPKGVKELVISLQQALVLLVLNASDDPIPYRSFAEMTGIDDKELKLTIQSLSVAKYRVMSKSSKGPEVLDSDAFTWNADFMNGLVRIKINQIQAKEAAVEEEERTNEKVMEDRQYQIDACIVRVMKARKRLEHKDLVAVVFSQLRFEMKASDLKKRIESLIEREYLERDSQNANVYHYVA